MTLYAKHLSTKQTPQSEPIPGKAMLANSAGGFAFAIDDWTRLDRFLVLGCEGGTYYAAERKLTVENAACVLRCLELDAARTVARIADISESGRAPKNDPAIFALALAASRGSAAAKRLAGEALVRVCRTGTHLFQFVAAVRVLRGWGRGLRRMVATWYRSRDVRDLAYQCVKYQAREKWTHRDLLRLAHVKAEEPTNSVLHWVVKGWEGVGDEPHPQRELLPIWAFERAKRASNTAEMVRLIRDFDLVRECVPTHFLNEAEVWEALLEKMPLTAMVRNLATMTRVGLLAPIAEATKTVRARLADAERLRKARVHPIAVLSALKTYAQGRGERGKNVWTPVQSIVDALDAAFYLAFGNVEATGKRHYLGVDVSGSMDAGTIAGVPGLTPRLAAAALALVTAATEPETVIMGFSNTLVPLKISPRMRLDNVVEVMQRTPMGGTDCAQPMLHALKAKLAVEAFCVYTDSETWAGSVHPVQALAQYRDKTGLAAKLVVAGFTSTQFSIADPNDAGMLDVVGMDTATPQLIADFVRS